MNEREKLLVTLQNRIDEARNNRSKVATVFISTLSKCMELLKSQPQIVRCKECKHHKKDTCSAVAGMAFPPPDDWFCADGEAKADG